MRILVTGSLGIVGRGLVAELELRGHKVFGCDLRHAQHEVGFSVADDESNPTYARCDVAEYTQLERIFDKLGPFDIVFHCAAEFGRWNGEDFYETLWKTNVIGTKHLIRLQESWGFRLVHFSSSEVYGDWQGVMAESVMEDYEIKQMNDYAMTKWVNEMQLRNSAVMHQTETVVVRLFNTYGPGEYYSPYRSVNCRFVYCALKGIPFTVYRGHTRTSTYLSDTCKTVANIADNFRPGEVYNIGGKHEHTIEELAETVLQVTGASESLVQYRDSEAMTTTSKKVDTSKCARDLGHSDSVDLEAGLGLTAEWMRKVYEI